MSNIKDISLEEDKPFTNSISIAVQKMKKDLFTYLPAVLIPAIIGVFSITIYTNKFKPEEYGLYSLILSTSLLFSTIISQWIQQSIQRFRPYYKAENKLNQFNFNLKYLFISVELIFCLGALCFLPVIYMYFRDFLVFYVLGILVTSAQSMFIILLTLLQSDFKAKMYRIYNVSNALLKFLLSLLLIYFWKTSVISIFLGFLAALVIVLIPMLMNSDLFQKKQLSHLNTQSVIQFTQKFFYYGFPMLGWFLGNMILNITDRYMIQFLRSSAEVGIYNANYSIVTSCLTLICNPLLTAAHPIIMNAANSNSNRDLTDIISKFSMIFIMVTLPLITFISFFHQEIASILLGKEFREGSVIIPTLLFGNIIWSLGMYGHKGLEIKGKTKIMLKYVLISSLFNVLLNFILVPKYGILGSAWATFISLTSYPLQIYFASKKKNEIEWLLPFKKIFFIMFLSCVASSVVLLVHLFHLPAIITLLISGSLFIVIYLLFLLYFNILNRSIILSTVLNNRRFYISKSKFKKMGKREGLD